MTCSWWQRTSRASPSLAHWPSEPHRSLQQPQVTTIRPSLLLSFHPSFSVFTLTAGLKHTDFNSWLRAVMTPNMWMQCGPSLTLHDKQWVMLHGRSRNTRKKNIWRVHMRFFMPYFYNIRLVRDGDKRTGHLSCLRCRQICKVGETDGQFWSQTSVMTII